MKTKTVCVARFLRIIAPACFLPLIVVTTARAQTYTLTTIGTFTGAANGADIYAGVTLDATGNVYGAAFDGGASGDGTVYEIAAGANTITTLGTFTGDNGANPYGAPILDSSGNLYGTTFADDTGGDGTFYEIAAGTNTITTLANFTGANGTYADSTLAVDSSGNLYGTAAAGGANDKGTVFEIAAGTNTITTLVSFAGANGKDPGGNLTFDSSGNLYGTTTGFAGSNTGTVWEIAAGTHTFTTLATFTAATGGNPLGGLVFDAHGDLYGTTYNLGAGGEGTIFEIAAGTDTLTTLYSFSGTDNGDPGGLTIDSSGNIFGTTEYGGPSGNGTVFEIAAGATTPTTLYAFSGAADGSNPVDDLTLDSSGDLYGTTYSGGASNDGTVFKLTPNAASAPEPGALALLLPGLALGWARMRARKG